MRTGGEHPLRLVHLLTPFGTFSKPAPVHENSIFEIPRAATPLAKSVRFPSETDDYSLKNAHLAAAQGIPPKPSSRGTPRSSRLSPARSPEPGPA